MKIPSSLFTSSNWHNHSSNPIIRPLFPNTILADPWVVTPNTSPDGSWHLFCHTAVGLNHYTSPDGLTWRIYRNLFLPLAFRPHIYFEHSTYYLLFERPSGLHKFPFYNSKIMICHSTDLSSWSIPQDLLLPSLPWHTTANKHHNVGNPSLVKIHNIYHLYYTSGLTYMKDYHMCEPTITSVAFAKHPLGPYTFKSQPISSFSHQNPLTKIPVAPSRIYQFKNLLIGLQTCFHTSNQVASSVIRFIASTDGISWHSVSKPIITTDQPWKKTYIYVGCLVQHLNEFRIYYNARYGNFFTPEAIGVSLFQPQFLHSSHKQARTPGKRVL